MGMRETVKNNQEDSKH